MISMCYLHFNGVLSWLESNRRSKTSLLQSQMDENYPGFNRLLLALYFVACIAILLCMRASSTMHMNAGAKKSFLKGGLSFHTNAKMGLVVPSFDYLVLLGLWYKIFHLPKQKKKN